MTRVVEPEILDQLPVETPEARGSRCDLVRINSLMRHPHLIRRAMPARITSVVDLGAGDGTLLASVIRKTPANIKQIVLVDRQNIVSADTMNRFKDRGIKASVVASDVFDWLRQPRTIESTAIIANLFLHHFKTADLRELLGLASNCCDVFIACEPRRGAWPAFAASLLGLIGCNEVTRHDARVSVKAGFHGRELTALWPKGNGWQISETEAGLFSHLFVARRTA